MNDDDTPTYAQKVKFLQTSPITKNLATVTSDCVIHLDHGQLTPGPDNVHAVAVLAQALRPNRIG